MGEIDIITTGRLDLTEYAGENGFLRGARLDKSERYYNHGVEVDFLDMHWERVDYESLLEAAKKHRPKYAVAGDYLRDEDNTNQVNEFAERLRRYADNVIVVPKSEGDLENVPSWCIVGYSTPTDYGGTDIPLKEYRFIDQPIHVLGGTPHKQIEVVGKLWLDSVQSLDGNSIHKAATIGAKCWNQGYPHWSKIDGDSAVERAYRQSVDNLREEYLSRGFM